VTRLSFSEHPASVGESYLAHLHSAAGFALAMVGGGVACLVHSVFPFLFVRTGSGVVAKLHDRMVVRRFPPEPRAAAGPSARARAFGE
jgi:hypothetical protein